MVLVRSLNWAEVCPRTFAAVAELTIDTFNLCFSLVARVGRHTVSVCKALLEKELLKRFLGLFENSGADVEWFNPDVVSYRAFNGTRQVSTLSGFIGKFNFALPLVLCPGGNLTL